MKDMVGEDWIDMLILESKATLDIGAMDSGIIFDHDNNDTSMSSMNTKGYMNKNTTAGITYNNGTTTVKGFATTKNLYVQLKFLKVD